MQGSPALYQMQAITPNIEFIAGPTPLATPRQIGATSNPIELAVSNSATSHPLRQAAMVNAPTQNRQLELRIEGIMDELKWIEKILLVVLMVVMYSIVSK